MSYDQTVTINQNILGGTPVFTGTRVPIRALIDYLAGGDSLSVFLEEFPSVSRRQAQQVLAIQHYFA